MVDEEQWRNPNRTHCRKRQLKWNEMCEEKTKSCGKLKWLAIWHDEHSIKMVSK